MGDARGSGISVLIALHDDDYVDDISCSAGMFSFK